MGKTGTPRFKNEVGNKYGNLTVLEFKGTNKVTSFWLCECTCGQTTITRGNTLRSGRVESCGKCGYWKKPIDPLVIEKRLFRTLKNGAKSRNLKVDIGFEDFVKIINQNCYWCDVIPSDRRFSWTRKPRNRHKDEGILVNGVDRLDNNLGYTAENSIPCCEMCNKMKSDFSIDEFIKKVEMIHEHRTKTSVS